MTEDKFESFLKKNAESYNAPPARAPREEMWEAIQARRQAGPRVVYGGASGSPTNVGGRFGSRVWWAAAAAVVLVAGGIGIGRWSATPDAPLNTAATGQEAPSDRASASDSLSGPDAGGPPVQLAEAGVTEPTRSGSQRSASPDGRGSLAGPVSPRNGTPSGGLTAPGTSATSAYRVAAVNHLTQAEALLTSFKTRSPADQRMDAQLATWARELLSNTRLLLDSPIAADPERRPLLQDLELLLVQIVQLSPGSTPQDREIIEQTLKQDQVLTKLRTAIPAGQRGS